VTGLVMLPEVVTGNLAEKFGEISLYNQHANFELGSNSNSNSTSPWAIVCESATQPSRAASPLRERFPRGPRNASRAHAKAPTARRSGKEIVPEYDSDSKTIPGYNSDSNPFSASTPTPPTSLASGRTLMSPSPRTTLQSNPCQDQLPAWL
jgi:hypothetical protein